MAISHSPYFLKSIRLLAGCRYDGPTVRFALRAGLQANLFVPEHRKRSRTHLRHHTTDVPRGAGSSQVNLRHTRGFAYRCFLPDLTGFTNSHCTGPSLQRCFRKNWLYSIMPGVGVKPCYSGLQVQGTATSPPSAIFLQYTIYATFALVEADRPVRWNPAMPHPPLCI